MKYLILSSLLFLVGCFEPCRNKDCTIEVRYSNGDLDTIAISGHSIGLITKFGTPYIAVYNCDLIAFPRIIAQANSYKILKQD